MSGPLQRSREPGFTSTTIMPSRWSCRVLARNAGTNESKLSQAFRAVYGMTVFEYVRNRRMEEARRLLRRCNMSVTEIAFEVGYEHSCNFSVAYKRHFGVTPKSERSTLRH